MSAILVFVVQPLFAASKTPAFRFHLPYEPQTLDPLRADTEDLTYLVYNLWRGLLTYSASGSVQPGAAKECRWVSSKRLLCILDNNQKWSDGSDVVAEDFVRVFQDLMRPTNASKDRSAMVAVEGYEEIVAKNEPVEKLGVRAVSPTELEFRLKKEDADFLERLTHAAFAPRKKNFNYSNTSSLVFNGPYKLKQWDLGTKITLEANPHFRYRGSSRRPEVQIRFLPEEATALTLFDRKELDFLRRVPTSQILERKKDPGFFQVPLARFDYIGFGPTAVSSIHFRKALVHSVDYQEFVKVFSALGPPGCPSSPEKWTKGAICYDFNLKKANESWALVPPGLKTSRHTLFVSTAGGEDLRRIAEWYREQWKKNLDLEVDIQPLDFGVMTEEIKRRPPTLFRRGVPLDRPSCLSALENFETNDLNNLIRFSDPQFDSSVARLRTIRMAAARTTHCAAAMKRLMEMYVLIPQGRMHFSFLRSPHWKGMSINELGHFELAGLTYTP